DAAPPGSAEFALQHGTIDAILERPRLRPALGALVSMLRPAELPTQKAEPAARTLPPAGRRPVWETVELSRHPDRPSGRAMAARVFTELFELHGDREGADDDSIVAGVGRLGPHAVVVVAQDRGSRTGGHTLPSGFRKAQRAFTLAERLGLPLVTLVDTPGAAVDAEAEASGAAGAVAESLARLARLRTPIINVVLGEGGSGGALALSVGDRLLMLENAIFSVIAPEAASAILYHDAEHAHDLAARLKVTATDLVELRLVDRIVPEQPAAHEAPELMAGVLRQTLLEELGQLGGMSTKALLRRREERSRRVRQVRGRFGLLVRHPRSSLNRSRGAPPEREPGRKEAGVKGESNGRAVGTRAG
ncbi:MAG: carboxyl transferase domain-containing protein, partial [Candidatus Dormibacteraceae bacterium]